MKRFKVIGFDLDGTLVNSLPDLALNINTALADFDLPKAPESVVLTWVGNGAPVLLKRALDWAYEQTGRRLNEAEETLLKDNFYRYYGENVCRESKLYPHVKETLATLKERGYILAVITNKPTVYVEPVLRAFDIFELFTDTLGGQSLPAIKPHPAPLYYLCGKYGILPEEMLFVGDSQNDILAAQRAGASSVGLTYGYNYNQPIANTHPTWVMDDFAQLLTILT